VIVDPSAAGGVVVACGCASPPGGTGDADWRRAARLVFWLAWVSVAWMAVEGAVGLAAGVTAGSVALIGWALGSVIEGSASVMVAWRFSGRRVVSPGSERWAQRGVAVSFWVLAPLVAALAVDSLLTARHPDTSYVGMALTGLAVVEMPLLGRAKHRLGRRLDSAATAGEGTQNYVCAAQAAAVLVGLAVAAVWAGGWWVDPTIALGIAGWCGWEGRKAWRGEDCC
jgi:divalent metal cation (Fe/Co/Zn/Cd) transporter